MFGKHPRHTLGGQRVGKSWPSMTLKGRSAEKKLKLWGMMKSAGDDSTVRPPTSMT